MQLCLVIKQNHLAESIESTKTIKKNDEMPLRWFQVLMNGI